MVLFNPVIEGDTGGPIEGSGGSLGGGPGDGTSFGVTIMFYVFHVHLLFLSLLY